MKHLSRRDFARSALAIAAPLVLIPRPVRALIRTGEGAPLYPVNYEWDFANGAENWWCGSVNSPTQLVEGGFFKSKGPWQFDDNHLLAGVVRHGFVRLQSSWEETVNGVITNPTVFTGASFTVTFKGVGINLGAAKAISWIQSRFPGGDNIYSNNGLIANNWDADLLDGLLHTRTFVIPDDPAAFVYGGAPGSQRWNLPYGYMPISQALENIHNFFPFIFLHPLGAQEPTGELWVKKIAGQWLSKKNPAGQPQPPSGTITTILDPAMTGASTFNSGVSFRGVGVASPVSWAQARITVFGSPSGPTSATHMALGKHAGGGASSIMPVEFKLLGSTQSGFALSANQTAQSDWQDFPGVAGEVPLAILDSGSFDQARTPAAFAGGSFNKTGQTWNVQSPTGLSPSIYYFGFKIEVR